MTLFALMIILGFSLRDSLQNNGVKFLSELKENLVEAIPLLFGLVPADIVLLLCVLKIF